MCAVAEPAGPSTPRPRNTPLQWFGLAVFVLLFLYMQGFLQPGALVARLPFLVAIVIAITIHEFAHGFVATLFGDDVPRRAGRLTLNPLKHLDPLGTIMIFLAPIGWGRPMPINPNGMRNPALGWALSAAAGPISNVLLAALVIVALVAVPEAALPRAWVPYVEGLIVVNVGLAVFNLVPLPPLDGFGFLYGLSPRRVKQAIAPVAQFGPLLLLGLLFLPMLVPGAPDPLRDGLAVARRVVFSWLEALASAL